MFFHEIDSSFNRINSAIKRVDHFAVNTQLEDDAYTLAVAFYNFKYFIDLLQSNDYSDRLFLIDWVSSKINNYCDKHKINDDPVAQNILYKFSIGGYLDYDFSKLK